MTTQMDDVMRKVQALLAKADSTDNQHEAAAFYAKAEEMILRHSLDEAALRAANADKAKGERPIMVEFEFSSSDQNAAGKTRLMMVVAKANRVRPVFMHNRRYSNVGRPGNSGVASQWVSLVGYASDIEMTKVMYASLLAQSARLGSKSFKDLGLRSGRSAFLTSYLAGFAVTCEERFAEMRSGALTQETSALIVRVEQEVDDAVRAIWPHLGRGRSHSFGSMAYGQGRMGGHSADLGQARMGAGSRALGSGR